MKNTAFNVIVKYACILCLCSMVTTNVAYSDDDDRHEEALKQRQSGRILPYEDILSAISPLIDGEIIETEFEIEDGQPAYEFKYIDPSGQIREMYVNAETGKIIKDEVD